MHDFYSVFVIIPSRLIFWLYPLFYYFNKFSREISINILFSDIKLTLYLKQLTWKKCKRMRICKLVMVSFCSTLMCFFKKVNKICIIDLLLDIEKTIHFSCHDGSNTNAKFLYCNDILLQIKVALRNETYLDKSNDRCMSEIYVYQNVSAATGWVYFLLISFCTEVKIHKKFLVNS